MEALTIPQFLFTLGAILLLGLLTDAIGRRTFLPRVTLLLLFGILIGNEVLDLIPVFFSSRFELIANMALLMIGFLLGGKLTAENLRREGSQILWISITAAVGTTLVVMSILLLAGVPAQPAILLACIAAATAPAATVDLVIESGKSGRFGNVLMAIVALDDVWGLMLFSIGIAVVISMDGAGSGASPMLVAMKEIGGAIVLGAGIGFPAAYLTGRIKPGQPMLTEALGIVFVCGGIAIWLEVSFLIAAIVMGAIIANFARHHEYPFHEIEGVEWPLLAVFFILAGASLEFAAMKQIGAIGMIYIAARIVGKYLGAWIGSVASGADKVTRNWIGLAMLPQAGAAIGMALVAANQFPHYRQTLLAVVISSTIFFEIVGPVLTRIALRTTRV
ncbi:MAG: sodium:proton antiporter [Acidithiobacillales bacterium SG8_45]|nr:MAG: sodium:proton antiporter [Acidithiobacillales bacterium SG8_45]